MNVNCIIMVCFFFFSSRRRHTRYWRDWSSDVCSSDLRATVRAIWDLYRTGRFSYTDVCTHLNAERDVDGNPVHRTAHGGLLTPRSEERRVGKECRSRWSPYH